MRTVLIDRKRRQLGINEDKKVTIKFMDTSAGDGPTKKKKSRIPDNRKRKGENKELTNKI